MNIRKLLPFLDEESKQKLVESILNKEVTDIELVNVYPFLGIDALNDIYEKYLSKEYEINIKHLLPFLGKDKIEELYYKVVNQEITDLEVEAILPFLGREKIKKIFEEYLDSLKK